MEPCVIYPSGMAPTTGPVTPTDARLREIAARAEAATKGPWKLCSANADKGGCACGLIWSIPNDQVVATSEEMIDGDQVATREQQVATGHFIASARADVPWLLALVEEQRTREKELREALDILAIRLLGDYPNTSFDIRALLKRLDPK